MKKTISISLASQKFTLEEDAYHKLTTYLEEIKDSLANEVDREEVMTDIETALAEKLKALLNNNKETINLSDVDKLIKIMGTKEDFARDMGTNSEEPEKHTREEKTQARTRKKTLYRDTDDDIIAGICAGLGNYFDVNPWLFRFIFIILTIFSGVGIVLYIIFWIFLPEAKTTTQKLEMRGEEPTVETLKKFLKEKKDKSTNFLKLFFHNLGMILRKLWQVFRKLIGFFLVAGSLVSIAAILFGGITLLLYRQSNYLVDFIPARELASLFPFNFLLFSGVLAILIPCIFILLVGLATLLETKRKILNFKVVAILIALWMFAGISLAAIGTRYLPDAIEKVSNYPAIQPSKITLLTEGIQTLKLTGRITAIYNAQATSSQLIISGRKIDLSYLQIKNSTDTIELRENSYQTQDFKCLSCYLERVTVLIPKDSQLQILTANGATVIPKELPALPDSPKVYELQ